MSVKIRLKRMGRLHRASFRIVACDVRSSRDGEVIEKLGSYDPLGKVPEQQVQLNAERVEHWLSVGAQPTATVARLLKKKGIQPAAIRAKLKTPRKTKDEGQEPRPKA